MAKKEKSNGVATFKNGTAPNQIIVNQITMQSTPRNTQSVDIWRNALRSWENPMMPNRTPMFDLLDDIMLDGKITTVIEKRKDKLLNRELLFVRDGQEDEELNKLLNCYDMYRLMGDLLESVWFGHILIQVNDIRYDEDEEQFKIDYDVIPKKHVHPEKDWECISRGQTLSKDILYKERPLYDYLIEAGSRTGFGLLYKAAVYVIYKRGGYGDWAQFSEMFGMPFREGVYDAFDETGKVMLNKSLEEWGGASWMTHPKGTEIKIHDVGGSNGSSSGPYASLIAACDSEIAQIFLGNTLTTEQGEVGSQALGTVHSNEQNEKTAADARFVLSILNGKFKAILKRFGFNVTGGEIWHKSPDKDWLQLKTKWDVISGVMDKGVPVADEFIYEEFDIPQPDNYDQLKADATAKKQAEEDAKKELAIIQKQQKKKDSEQEQELIKQQDRNFFIRLIDFFAVAPTMWSGASSGKVLTLSDQEKSDNPILNYIWEQGGKAEWSPELFQLIASPLIEALHKGLQQGGEIKLNDFIGYTYNFQSDAVTAAMEMNVMQFSSAKGIAEIAEFNKLFRESKGFADFYQKASAKYEIFNKQWAETEYNTAYRTAELSAARKRMLSKSTIFPYWQYKIVDDGHTREEHYKLRDLILKYDDTRWNEIYPPNGWNCRCYVVPITEADAKRQGYNLEKANSILHDFFADAVWKNAKAQGFGVNRIDNYDIFKANQNYLRRFPENAERFLDRLTFEAWGLKSAPQLWSKNTTTLPSPAKTIDEFLNTEFTEGKIVYKDYSGKEVILTKESFVNHTLKKSDNRYPLIKAAEETINNPDELWINTERLQNIKADKLKFDQYTAIKYYDGTAVVVNYTIEDDFIMMRTWYELSPKRQVQRLKRRGLLIEIKKPE